MSFKKNNKETSNSGVMITFSQNKLITHRWVFIWIILICGFENLLSVDAAAPCSPGRISICSTCVAVDAGVVDINGFLVLTVTTVTDELIDNGILSLREAVITANYVGGGVKILLPNGIPLIELAGRNEDLSCTGDFDLPDTSNATSLEINTRPGTLGIDAQGLDRHFDVMKLGLVFTFKALPLHPIDIINGAVIDPPTGQGYGGSIRGYKVAAWLLQWLNFRNNSLVGSSPVCTGMYCGLHGGALGFDLVDTDALSLEGSNINVINCTFTSNYVIDTTSNSSLPRKAYGGAIGVPSGSNNTAFAKSLNITGCHFTNNTAQRGGGAVSMQHDLNFYARFCVFTNNKVIYPNGSTPIEFSHGGGIFFGFLSDKPFPSGSGGGSPDTGMRIRILDCNFTSNTASLSGGGVAIVEENTIIPVAPTPLLVVTLTSVIFTENTARMSGGGIFLGHHTTSSLLLCSMVNNYIVDQITTTIASDIGGGGILAQGGSVFSFVSGSVTGNISPMNGGGIYYSTPSGSPVVPLLLYGFTISDALIYNNTAGPTGDGGGICINYNSTTVQLQLCNILANSANRGGGIFGFRLGGTFNILRSSITNNTALTEGGGFYCNRELFAPFSLPNGGTQISLTTVSSNTAKSGGGIILTGTALSTAPQYITYSTIVYNTATDENRGAGIDMASSASVYPFLFNNNIIAENIGNITNESLYSEDFHIMSGYLGPLSIFKNLIQDQSELVSGGSFSLTMSGNLPDGSRPNLGILKNNGGTTLSHFPNSCSIVRNFDAVNSSFTLDQRDIGFPRVLQTLTDLGSIESLSPNCAIPDSPACMVPACNSSGFCVDTPLVDGSPCNNLIPDGTCQNPDKCISGICTAGSSNSSLCSLLPNYGTDCFSGCSNDSAPQCQFILQGSECSPDTFDPNSITCVGPQICEAGTCQTPTFNSTRCTLHTRYGTDCFVGCNGTTGECQFINNGTLCADVNPIPTCVGHDMCLLGTCTPSETLDEALCESLANFGVDCFIGCSNVTKQCLFIANNTMCNNGIPDGSCQNPDKCINGVCTTVLIANVTECNTLPQYGIDCFVQCDPETLECIFIPNGDTCDDGIPNGSCQNPDICESGFCLPGSLNETLCTFLPEYGVDCFSGCNGTTMNCEFYSQNQTCSNDTTPLGTCQMPVTCIAGTCTEGSINETLCQTSPQYGIDCFFGCDEGTLDCLFTLNGSQCDNGINEGTCIMDIDVCSNGNCISTFQLNETLCLNSPQYGTDCLMGCDQIGGDCIFIPFGGYCDDGNPFTFNDTCLNGTCVGTGLLTVQYQCGSFLCETPTYSEVNCLLYSTDPSLCEFFDDGNQCTRDFCNETIGLCIHEPYPEGKYCDYWKELGFNQSSNLDGPIRTCTTLDMCIQGVCTRGDTLICDNCTILAGTDAFKLGIVPLNISLPLDFFAPGSDPIPIETIFMMGAPLDIRSLIDESPSFNTSSSEIHLLIERSDHAYLNSPDDIEIVPVHIVSLKLRSIDLFYPTFEGIPTVYGWNLECQLSEASRDTFGTFAIRSSDCSCERGGIFIPYLPSISLDCVWTHQILDITLSLNGVVIQELLPPVIMPWYSDLNPIFGGDGNVTTDDLTVIDTADFFVQFSDQNDTRPLAPNHKKFYPGVLYDKCDGCDFFAMCKHDTDCDDGLICTTDSCETIIINGYEPQIVRYCKNSYNPSVGDDCYYGPPETEGVGECSKGSIVCLPCTGCLVCSGQILPSLIDLPNDYIDSNCDGNPDS